MEPQIRPEPTPNERAAILAALPALLAEDGVPAAYRSGWRVAGIRENVAEQTETRLGQPAGSERDSHGATARPRSSPGATRA